MKQTTLAGADRPTRCVCIFCALCRLAQRNHGCLAAHVETSRVKMHRQTRTRQTTVHKKPDLDAYTTFQLRPTSLRTDIYLYLDKLPHHLHLFTIINFGRKYNKGINLNQIREFCSCWSSSAAICSRMASAGPSRPPPCCCCCPPSAPPPPQARRARLQSETRPPRVHPKHLNKEDNVNKRTDTTELVQST